MAPRRLLDDETRLAWLQLARSDNVGPATVRALVNHFGGAQAALAALPELARRGGGRRPLRIYPRARAEQDMAQAAAIGARFVALGEPDYPGLLRHADHAPPLICVKGTAEVLTRPAVAVVGSRNASAAGRRFARQLAGDLGRAGWVVVSGLARGIDTAAHEAALATGTVAVMAGGLDHVYPPENGELFARIAAEGAAVSEMPPGTEPRADLFPRRNRIIAGLAAGVVIVEAAVRSGSLITARLAAEQGREVFAVPGSPLDPRAEGTNRLIRDGATLVTGADDVLEVLARLPGAAHDDEAGLLEPDCGPAELDEADTDDLRRRIVALLGPAPADIDDVIRESGAPPQLVITVLLELELAGRLERLPRQQVALT